MNTSPSNEKLTGKKRSNTSLFIGLITILIACGCFWKYYEAENYPEKVIESRKAEIKKKLDGLNELRAKNGNLGDFSSYSSEYDRINNVDYSDDVESAKNNGMVGAIIFGIVGIFAIVRWVSKSNAASRSKR